MTRPTTAVSGRHWSQMNEATFVPGLRLMFWIYRILGRWPARLILYPIVFWYMIAKPGARAASSDYLRRIAALDSNDIRPGRTGVLRHFASFAESILDKMLLWGGLFETDLVRLHGHDRIAAEIAARRGSVLICCHLGNLDLCRVLARRSGVKMTVLTHTKHAAKFNRLLAQLDPASQLNLMQVTEISPATAILLAEKVAAGECVAIAGDRIPVSAGSRVASAVFLGAPAPFPVGPYILASLFQCPVYLLFSLGRGRSPEIHFELFRESIRLPRNGRDRALAELASDYARRLEHYCLEAPLEWFNFYDFWQKEPSDARR